MSSLNTSGKRESGRKRAKQGDRKKMRKRKLKREQERKRRRKKEHILTWCLINLSLICETLSKHLTNMQHSTEFKPTCNMLIIRFSF